jgi:type IV pilus assembly protein PilX
VWSKNSFNNLQAKSHDWWQTHARPFPGKLAKVKTQPRFIIEQQEFVASELNPDLSAKQMGSHYYRVTARGTGSSNRSAALVQSIFVVKYN